MTDASQFKLIIEDDEGRRSVVPVDVGEVSIGRLEGNTIRLKERNVSRRHARLSRGDDGNIFCEDLDSYNGLWINGDRISGKRPLHEGDLMRIGDFQLELRGSGLLKRSDENTQRTSLGPDTQPGFQHDDLSTTADAVPVSQPPPPPPRPNVGPPPLKTFSPEPTLTDPDGPPQMLEPHEYEPTGLIRGGTDADLLSRSNNILPTPHAKLVCVSTQFAGKEYELMFAENIIGRTDDNQIGIDHRSVSRQHAKIVIAARRYRIVDMGSANGTLVNGEVYAQTELKRGDLIELGHVKLRFIPAGETYELTDEERAEITGKGRFLYALRKNLSLVVALLAIFVMAALIATYIMLSGSSDKSATLAMPPPPTPGNVNDESTRLLAQAHLAQGQKQWKRAQSMASAALELDPANEDAKVLAHNADSEMKAQHSFETAQQAAQSKAWSDAFNALQEVPKESCYYADGQQLLNQVKPQLASERVGDARTALKNEDFDDAELLVEELQDLDPQRREIAELKQAIDDGRKNKGIKVSPHPPHAKGQLQKVHAVPAPLSSHEPPPEDAKVLYADGTKALNGGLYAKAIELFGRCMMADKNFSMCYRAMGIAYAKSGNGPKAVRYYRLYLKVDPNARDAPQVKAMLQQYDAAAGGAPPGQ